jgi:hypothetical protein
LTVAESASHSKAEDFDVFVVMEEGTGETGITLYPWEDCADEITKMVL